MSRVLSSPQRESRSEDDALPPFTFTELFSGMGGFREGLASVGGRCIWACEIDHAAALTYEANFCDKPYADVTRADPARVPAHDLLAAGFPCQDFSGLGSQEGLAGSKGQLFYEVVRFLREKRPSMFLGENVSGLGKMQEGRVLEEVVSSLEALGYRVCCREYNSSAFVPQWRRRIFIAAFLGARASDAPFEWPDLPEFTPRRTMASVLEGRDENRRATPSRTMARLEACLMSYQRIVDGTAVGNSFLDLLKLTAAQWRAVQQAPSTMYIT